WDSRLIPWCCTRPTDSSTKATSGRREEREATARHTIPATTRVALSYSRQHPVNSPVLTRQQLEQATHFAPFWVKDVARAETLMGSRFHVPDMVSSPRLSLRGFLQAESTT